MNYTKRSDFPAELPDKKTQYCWICHSSGAIRRDQDGIVSYFCDTCGASSPRVLIYDPQMIAWFDGKDRLVHESCGVFLKRSDEKLLLFKRTKFPYLLTIPAGHLEINEQPDLCAIRETEEEVGLKVAEIKKVFEGNIEGDSCLGGADIHKWHAYVADINPTQENDIKLDEEGSGWDWYDISDLNKENTVQPVLYIIKNSRFF